MGLGTVQFGTEYGVSNSHGQIPENTVQDILQIADEAGFEVLDTASQYGTSESVLGRTLHTTNRFCVVTKTPTSNDNIISDRFIADVEARFYGSLENLKLPSVEGLLVHHGKDILKSGGEKFFRLLVSLREQGLVKKIGFSIYDGEELDSILEMVDPDVVQIPLSIFDQRLVESGHLKKLKHRNIEVHCRSIFLQGAALMLAPDLPKYFNSVRSKFEALDVLSISTGYSKLELCLLFAFQLKDIDVALVGVTSVDELEKIIQASKNITDQQLDFSALAINDSKFINPSNWQL